MNFNIRNSLFLYVIFDIIHAIKNKMSNPQMVKLNTEKEIIYESGESSTNQAIVNGDKRKSIGTIVNGDKGTSIETVIFDDVEFIVPFYPTDEKYENITFLEKEFPIPRSRPVRIYCDGIFDMFHYGHARLFEQVKNMFPSVSVVVGVCNDELTIKYKGAIVMNEKERYESVRQCKFVDEVIENAPWTISPEFLEEHRIDLVAHDEAPYPCSASDTNIADVYKFVKDRGLFVPTKRATHISTTKIITGIIKNYDLYLRRQILRGISYKELNISFLKSEHIRFKNIVSEDLEMMRNEFKEAFDFWEKLSKKWFNKVFRGNPSVFSKVISMVKEKANKK